MSFFTKRNEQSALERQLGEFLSGKRRAAMLLGERYFEGKMDIQKRRRTVIGARGEVREVTNLPNHKVCDNQYARAVIQKASYLCGRAPLVKSDSERLRALFDAAFFKTLKDIAKDTQNCGIGYMYLYVNEGALRARRFAPYEIMPIYSDCAHSRLEGALRVYSAQGQTRAELYSDSHITRYSYSEGRLRTLSSAPYMEGFSWGSAPIVAFRANEREQPLIERVKSLQDALNELLSDMMNNLSEDCRNSVLVLENYDGESLEEFRQNLAAYGVVKVKSVDGAAGGVRTLSVKTNVESYERAAAMLRRAIVENALSCDVKSLGASNPNQLSILSMYADIDLDANECECEFACSFAQLIELAERFLGERSNTRIIFDRDIIVSESESIENCVKSKGVLPDEIIYDNHPWTKTQSARG